MSFASVTNSYLNSLFVLFILVLSGCGAAPYDISNETDRKAMMIDIRNALTQNDCPAALELSYRLYSSEYSDNEIRMLYAAAHGCNVGIQMFPIMDLLTVLPLSTEDEFFKAMVQIFPSRSALDSRLQSGLKAQDAVQAVLKPGTVVGHADKILFDSYNIGSVWSRDRTDDANTFLGFTAMSIIGTTLNRYGYAVSDDPVALGYAQSVALPWLNMNAVKIDPERVSCGLASSMLNLIDSMNVLSSITTGSISTVFSTISSTLSTAVTISGNNECTVVNGFSQNLCDAAAQRLRYRNSCYEGPGNDPMASYAAGIIKAIEAGWL